MASIKSNYLIMTKMEGYKEKYEQLTKFIRDLHPFMTPYCKEKTEAFFSAQKESEDEKIRKELIRAFSVTADKRDNEIYGNGITYGQVLAWLEKQGEQKCLDKTEIAEQFARIIRGHLTQIDKEVQLEFENLYTEITGKKMYGGYID